MFQENLNVCLVARILQGGGSSEIDQCHGQKLFRIKTGIIVKSSSFLILFDKPSKVYMWCLDRFLWNSLIDNDHFKSNQRQNKKGKIICILLPKNFIFKLYFLNNNMLDAFLETINYYRNKKKVVKNVHGP